MFDAGLLKRPSNEQRGGQISSLYFQQPYRYRTDFLIGAGGYYYQAWLR